MSGSKASTISATCLLEREVLTTIFSDQCRSAREKCDGIQPICFTCASSNRHCTYTTNPKRRGIQPGYIRTLELTLAWTLSNVSGSEEAIVNLLQDEKGQALIASNDTAAANKLHKKWRNHVISSAIDRILSGERIGELFEQPALTSGDEEDEDEIVPEPVLPQTSFLTPDSLKTGASHFPIDDFAIPDAPVSYQPLAPKQPFDGIARTAKLLQLPANHWRLVDVYFAYTHSWLPLVSKEQILKLCYSYPSSGMVVGAGRQSADHAELWSILALASVQNASTQTQQTVPSQQLLGVAESLIQTTIEDADIGHVGAMLNLSLVNIATQRLKIAWTLLGRAGRLIIWLLYEQAVVPITMSRVQERLQGLALGCFVVETFLAAQLELLPSLRSDQVQRIGLLSEEGLDEWQPWSGCEDFQNNRHSIRPTQPSQARSTFNQLVKLSFIVNDRIAAHQLGAPQARSLSNWLSTLPAALGPLHSMNPEQTSPQKLQLFLAFLVGRASDANQREIIEEALALLDHFTFALGLAAMPPLFACFLQILKRTAAGDGFQQNRLAGILKRFSTVWRESGKEGELIASSPSTIGMASPVQNDGNAQITPKPPAAVTSIPDSAVMSPDSLNLRLQRTNSLQQPMNPGVQHHLPPANLPNGLLAQSENPQYENHIHPRSYSATDQSMDLDALFDHFTSVEGLDHTGAMHPQFMQNLGFSAGTNLTDLMASDYSWALDPG